MEIKRTAITIKELTDGYINETDTDIETLDVRAYGGKLCVRPAYQRSFIYDTKQQSAVIDTALKGYPLNTMYWVDNGDGTYDCLDGQQRTISLCNFVNGYITSIVNKYFNSSHNVPDNFKLAISDLYQYDPELAEKFMNYELEVYICKGTKAEQMEWFRTINIAGEELSPQELRNANYVSAWLTDAKRYFSKASSSSTAKCPAERVGGMYTNKNANRQEILAQVISWKINSDKDEDICNYMGEHINDTSATELWDYFNDVINWAKELFPAVDDKGLATVNWGELYNAYSNEEFDPNEIAAKIEELVNFKASKELDVSMAKIIEYCITRDQRLLKHRKFTDVQRTAMYNRQKGICPDCGEHYIKTEMEAHHEVPWYNGGVTELSNGVMLCKECHNQRHL